MSSKMRSPSYPSTPISHAIDLVEKVFSKERTNPVDRTVAAQAMGYGGLSGRSAKMLADLNQYGLLERAGKNEVRVTRRAMNILHPDNDHERVVALREAAEEPPLFQRIRGKFPDGLPSTSALRSYLLKENFTDAALMPAVSAYLETYRYLEDADAYESHGRPQPVAVESVPEQQHRTGTEMTTTLHTPQPRTPTRHIEEPQHALEPPGKLSFTWLPMEAKIRLAGVINNKQEAQSVITFIQAMMIMLNDVPDADGEADSQPN